MIRSTVPATRALWHARTTGRPGMKYSYSRAAYVDGRFLLSPMSGSDNRFSPVITKPVLLFPTVMKTVIKSDFRILCVRSVYTSHLMSKPVYINDFHLGEFLDS